MQIKISTLSFTSIQLFNDIPEDGLMSTDYTRAFWLGHDENIKNIAGNIKIDENKYEIRQANEKELQALYGRGKKPNELFYKFIQERTPETKKWTNNLTWRKGEDLADFAKEVFYKNIKLYFIVPKGQQAITKKRGKDHKLNFAGICTKSCTV